MSDVERLEREGRLRLLADQFAIEATAARERGEWFFRIAVELADDISHLLRFEPTDPPDRVEELMPESALALPGYEFSEAYRERLRQETEEDLPTMLDEPNPLI